MGTENSQNEVPRGRVGRKTNDNNKKQGTINNSTHVKEREIILRERSFY